MVPWGLLIFVVGIIYGWLSPGRQDKGRLFRNGLIIGLVLALVLALLGWMGGANPVGLDTLGGAVGLILAVIVMTLLFILGAWIGDLIEGGTRRRTV
jgi:hypothetical protein